MGATSVVLFLYLGDFMNIIHGDCLEELKKLEDDSIDAVVCDPPYGLSNTKPQQVADVLKEWVAGDPAAVPAKKGGFMGKDWDSFVPPPAVWEECMRVLKPGGHMAVFSGARTQDLMGLSIRLAGFEIRDTLGWVYGSGMPKSHNISKAIDKAAGAEREVVGQRSDGASSIYSMGENKMDSNILDVTAPATSEAQRWDGWGTALKPAIEPIILARKPLDGTVANNVLAHGVGGLNIDACRVAHDEPEDHTKRVSPKLSGVYGDGTARAESDSLCSPAPAGRFPANVLLDEHAAKEMDKQSGPAGAHGPRSGRGTGEGVTGWMTPGTRAHPNDSGGASRFFPVFKSEGETPETKGRFPANVLLDEHAAAEMDEQSGPAGAHGTDRGPRTKGGSGALGWGHGSIRHTGDPGSGGASRFFPVFKYQAKAPKKERPVIEREDGSKIQHPTVKPLALLEWLVELITPPGGTVLDPFAGSGTTLQAALNKGFQPIGIEQDADYIKLIEKRLEATCTTHKN